MANPWPLTGRTNPGSGTLTCRLREGSAEAPDQPREDVDDAVFRLGMAALRLWRWFGRCGPCFIRVNSTLKRFLQRDDGVERIARTTSLFDAPGLCAILWFIEHTKSLPHAAFFLCATQAMAAPAPSKA